MHKRILTIFSLFIVGVILTAGYALFSPHTGLVIAQTSNPGTLPNPTTPAPGQRIEPVTPVPGQRIEPVNPAPSQRIDTTPAPDGQMTPTTPVPTQPATPGTGTTQSMNDIDRWFAREAAETATGNIQLARLALQKSQTEAVRNFANAEIQEQTKIQSNLTQLAPQMGMMLPTTLSNEYQVILTRLLVLDGEDFDRAYMDEGGVNAHLEHAALFQRQAAFGQNPELVTLATDSLPTVKRHFETATNATNYQFAAVPRNYSNASTSSSR